MKGTLSQRYQHLIDASNYSARLLKQEIVWVLGPPNLDQVMQLRDGPE